jgi:hypothetical protein
MSDGSVVEEYRILMDSIENPVGLTLDMKQQVEGEILDHYTASQTIRHFLARLNRKVFGNRNQNRGMGVQVFPVIEGGGATGKRIHAHLTIGRPTNWDPSDFHRILLEQWRKCRFSYRFPKISQITDNYGWNSYLLKRNSKHDGISGSIDASNIHI